MYSEQIVWSNAATVAVGDQVNTASRDYQQGLATVEIASTGANPEVKLYGKLIKSDVASTDSGWVELQSWTADSANYVAGATVDIYPYMSASITGNTAQRDVLVVVGYNSKNS